MVALLSVLILIAGSVSAAFADRGSAFERIGGFLVVGSLTLIGAGLPLLR
jgi:hypothetical protein